MTVNGMNSSDSLKMDPLMVTQELSFSGKKQYVLEKKQQGYRAIERAGILGFNNPFRTTQWADQMAEINRAMVNNPNKFKEWIHDAKLTDSKEILGGAENLSKNLRNVSLRYLESLRKHLMEKNPKLVEEFRDILKMKSTDKELIVDDVVIDTAIRHLHEQQNPQICQQLIQAMNRYRKEKICLISKAALDIQVASVKEAYIPPQVVENIDPTDVSKEIKSLQLAVNNNDKKYVELHVDRLKEFFSEAYKNRGNKKPHEMILLCWQLGECVKLLKDSADCQMFQDLHAKFKMAHRENPLSVSEEMVVAAPKKTIDAPKKIVDVSKEIESLRSAIAKKNQQETLSQIKALLGFFTNASTNIDKKRSPEMILLCLRLGDCVKLMKTNAETLTELLGEDRMEQTCGIFENLHAQFKNSHRQNPLK